MTASNTICHAIARLRRTIIRTLRGIHLKALGATLTLSLPPFVKLEIKTEISAKRGRHRRRCVA